LKLEDFMLINPRLALTRGARCSYVPMEAIRPGRRYVRSQTVRSYASSGSRFQPNDVLFARITPCLENGKIAQFSATSNAIAFGSTEFFVFRARPGISDPSFVYYLALSAFVRRPAEKSMSGASGRQRADPSAIAHLRIPPISLEDQKRVCRLLEPFDDLVDNCDRRMALLEESATALFRQWFEEFQSPLSVGSDLAHTPIGLVPATWEVCELRDAVEIHPKIPITKTDSVPFISMGALLEHKMSIEAIDHRSRPAGSRFQNGDTLLARITPCLENGKTGFVQCLESDSVVACGSTEFIVLRPKRVSPEFVYLLARSEQLRSHAIKSMTGASGRQRVQESRLGDLLVPVPDKANLDAFTRLVRPLFQEIQVLHARNQTLVSARDGLLDSLIEPMVRGHAE
jgi:type I restriction enzyme S subunit